MFFIVNTVRLIDGLPMLSIQNGNTAWHVASDYRSASVLPLLAEQFTRPVFPPPEELSITEIGQAYSAPTPPLVLPNRPRLKERGLEG